MITLELCSERIKAIISSIKAINPDAHIVAATKTIPPEVINALPALGITVAGENRVQEWLGKVDAVSGIEWHFIGRLQTNKVKYLIDKIALIHSLDREDLARIIDVECAKRGRTVDALIEVNAGGEESKGGVKPEFAVDFAEKVRREFPHINIIGVMSVMPRAQNPDENKDLYLQIKQIYDILLTKNFACKYLSVGMSGDYLTALKYGANMVRLGTILFGERLR